MKQLKLPNVRKLIIPDAGYVMFEGDLKGADAQVVAWEADDEDLKAAFRSGMDVHHKNAEDMWGSEFTKLPLGSHAYSVKRQQNKVAVHLTNYGGTERTLAITQGWLVIEAHRFQSKWFGLHPKIKTNFQQRIWQQLQTTRTIYNPYGFRMTYFDRPDACYGQALAWGPQSTVAITCNMGFFQLQEKFPQVEPLLQNHDALTWQFPIQNCPPIKTIRETLSVRTPYADPLFIPWDLKMGTKSWGELEKAKEVA